MNGSVGMSPELPASMRTTIVSPMARPKPSITAAKMPLAAAGSTMRYVVCQRELPSAREPWRISSGTACSASSEIETIVGRQRIPTTRPAVNPVRPLERWNNSRIGWTSSTMPMSPKTTEGMAAMNSMMDFPTSRIRSPANSER